ncbi:kinase domain-containing protein [Thozetella sp. PMI_491]|nr:kinase domain-containing protein [Thozetella sp. PMI_491]
MWWDADTVDKTVTRQFVCSHLLPGEIERLDQPLGFGDGLTDGTYWEWIEEKAKKIFLILVDLGVPDQIFGVVDDSWDDQDLPIALDQVERLALTVSRDERSEKRFYYRQFYYLLRPLRKGDHNKYQEDEVVPLDLVDRKPGLGSSHGVDKVVLPGEPGKVFCRRRILLGSGPGSLSYEDFQFEVNSIRNIQNDHLVSYWASYTHQGYGYVLFTKASDYSLKSFLNTTPAAVKNMEKVARRRMVLNWIHCLVDTLCYIHNRGLSHGHITPSTVVFNNVQHISFADFTRFNTELMAVVDKTSFDKESYDYAAPEQWFKPTSAVPTSPIQRKSTFPSASTSPDNNYTFSINRGNTEYSPNNPMAVLHAPTPHLNPQAADIFSLGCVILELLSFLLKKHGRPFATHRAAKHKSAGRGGAVLDSSFHKNLTQVESWMTQLAKDASKKDDAIFRGFAPMLHLVERMLALNPADRPAAHDVQKRMYQVLTEACGIREPHCVHEYGGWDFGLGRLKLKTQPTVLNDNAETMSIATKRSSGSTSPGLYHRRTNSGNSSGSGGRMGSVATAVPREPTSPLSGVFEPLQSIRSRDKVRPGWQSPVYAA